PENPGVRNANGSITNSENRSSHHNPSHNTDTQTHTSTHTHTHTDVHTHPTVLPVLMVSERPSVHSRSKTAFFCPYLTGIFTFGRQEFTLTNSLALLFSRMKNQTRSFSSTLSPSLPLSLSPPRWL